MCDKFINEGFTLYSSDKEYPYRDFELINFYKKIKENNIIVGIEIDVDSKIISFIVVSNVKSD